MCVDRSDLRADFAASMSAMYKTEVPLYADLIDIVTGINAKLIDSQDLTSNLQRLTAERHGAIRLGTAQELSTVRRIFRLLDMHPMGYYDLSVAGLPMHATAFRPNAISSLEKNPFRVFTTLLRPELLVSDKARELAKKLLAQRNIFSDELMRILDVADAHEGSLTSEQAAVFVREALRTFSWQPVAASTLSEYKVLKHEHPILADIACFRTAHINHLTPRTLDISLAQTAMRERGLKAKERIEGPPPRNCPILLRQTSFLALEEKVSFHTDGDSRSLLPSTHTARFGEIEQRGAALTPRGRELYDALLSESTEKGVGLGADEAEAVATQVFASFPDTWEALRSQKLIYCQYALVKQPETKPTLTGDRKTLLEQLIAEGIVKAEPIIYEDFLPFSAAGIFRSNLAGSDSEDEQTVVKRGGDQVGLEKSMGVPLQDIYEWYSQVERSTLKTVTSQLGLAPSALATE